MKAQAKPRAVLTDDHPAVLAAAAYILRGDIDIVASAASGVQALEAVTLFQPELLILDIAMSGWNGFETAERVLRSSSITRPLFLTIYEDLDYMEKARQLGASYVFKRRMGTDLLRAALQTLGGVLFFSDLPQSAFYQYRRRF
jgi:DNA-binding NarL/FixJ family response regulator